MELNFQINFITVCRDFDLYKKLFEENPYVQSHKYHCLDNRQENLGIPQRYNQFLDAYNFNEESWLVFCHEDFKFNENILSKLSSLSPNYLYCPIGAVFYTNDFRLNFRENFCLPKRALQGQIVQKKKDGTEPVLIGKFLYEPALIDCADCCCLIVHSSLIQKYNLRFDENLTFDLYAEAFCIEAKEKYGVSTQVIQIDCEHWSGGNITQRYYNGLKYLNLKYPDSIYSGTISLIGGGTSKLNKELHDLLPFLKMCALLKIDLIISFLFKILDLVLPLMSRLKKKQQSTNN